MDDDDVNETSIAPDETPASKTGTSAANSTTSGDAAATTTTSTGAAGAADASATEASSDSAAAAPASDEPAPPKPPRPMSEQQKNEQTLKEAFPAVEMPVIKAVLTASRGNIEAAFHALLEMTDPEAAQQEPAPPPQPPRPVQRDPVPPPSGGRLSPYSQMVADEEYARQLAQHYEAEDGGYEARTSRGGYGGGGGRSRGGYQHGGETGLKPNEMWGDKEHSFLDDDLPVIQENLRKGFAETQTKFNTWFTGIKKKINEEWNSGENDDDEHQQGGPGGPSRGQRDTTYARYGSRQPPRRSGDYDADPELLSDDFTGIQLHGDGTPVRQNPNVFRPPPSSTSPRPGSERKVAFSDRDETIDMYSASPKLPPKDGPNANRAASPAAGAGGAKASKWQPMSSVDPTPMADNDPFSLGDSEDEKDNTTSTSTAAKKGDSAADKTDKTDNAKSSTSSTSPEDAERLRKAAAEAMADSLVEDKK
ncbi:ubiquitin-binding protein cue5 [Sporothrix stenoceras]|uniref:Ubiquitin-binding protein cue5 n=1 Tax=Sporothrix stenoceras TaxID=5173 RepID=A0ABR3ZN45_9PEZI